MLAGAVVNSISLLPHRDLKKMKEMPAERPVRERPRDAHIFVAMATASSPWGGKKARLTVLCSAAFDFWGTPEAEKPMR